MTGRQIKAIWIALFCINSYLLPSSLLSQENNEIVVTKKVNSPSFDNKKNSYCSERTDPSLLTWTEDFQNSNLSKADWTYAKGNSFMNKGNFVTGWGNNELQYYRIGKGKLNVNDNLYIEDGKLKIQPIFHKNKYKGFEFTSARIHTKGKRSFVFPAKISFCFKVPSGIGFWPAFWLMPVKNADWPQGGEIDIMENRGRISNISSSALHFGFSPDNKGTLVGEVMIPPKVRFQDKFHSITLVWLEDEIHFYLNNEKEPYFSANSKMPIFKKFGYPFNSAYYLIVNVAAGGIYDDYWVDKAAFCNSKECTNKADPDNGRFIIDWIEYQKLD
jgi:beta-glucanase (GH16 family)